MIVEVDLMVNFALSASCFDPLQIGRHCVHDGFSLRRADAVMVTAVCGKDVTAPPLLRMVFQPVRRPVLNVGLDLRWLAGWS